MPVNDQTTFAEYNGTGDAGIGYAIPFTRDNDSEVAVYLDGVSTNDFTITDDTVYTTAAIGTSVKVLVQRETDVEQTFNPPPAGAIQSTLLTRTLDRIVMMVQDLRRRANRALKVPKGESIADLPKEVLRADRYDYFDSSGDPTPKTAAETVLDLQANGGLNATPFEEITTATQSGGGNVTTASTTVLAGTASAAEQAAFQAQAGTSSSNIRLLVFGDSISDDGTGPYTAGPRPAAREPYWTTNLANNYLTAGGGTYEIDNQSTSGTKNLEHHDPSPSRPYATTIMDANLPAAGEQVIWVDAKGVNDFGSTNLTDTSGVSGTSRGSALTQHTWLLERAAAAKSRGMKVAVMIPLYDDRYENDYVGGDLWTYLTDGGDTRIQHWHDYIQMVMDSYKEGYFDYIIRADLLLPRGTGYDTSPFDTDNFHPAAKGNRMLAHEFDRVFKGGAPLDCHYPISVRLVVDNVMSTLGGVHAFDDTVWEKEYDLYSIGFREGLSTSTRFDGRIAIPRSGVWQLSFCAFLNTVTGKPRVSLFVNGSETKRVLTVADNANDPVTGVTSIELDQGDVVDWRYGSSGSENGTFDASTDGYFTRWEAHLIQAK